MKPRETWPVEAFRRAHLAFPEAVGREGLYAAAFFGHSHPHTKRSPESVWRGLCRREVRALANEVRP
jgi:hypothetical protein